MSSQQAATGVGSGRGDYETPDDLFAMLDLRVGGFTLDAAASHENTKVPALYCTAEGTFEYAHGEHFFRRSEEHTLNSSHIQKSRMPSSA